MAGGPVSDRNAMVAQMRPVLDPETYCFVVVEPDKAPRLLGSAIATFREAEGVSAIVTEAVARELEPEAPAFARITLGVYSDLEGVGLTAAVSGALADAGIACNAVAALHHDHLFVPAGQGEQALALLEKLSADVRGT